MEIPSILKDDLAKLGDRITVHPATTSHWAMMEKIHSQCFQVHSAIEA
jgi:hypothetical protein